VEGDRQQKRGARPRGVEGGGVGGGGGGSELFGRVESWGDLGCRWRDPRLAAVYFYSVGVSIVAGLAVSVVGFEKSECSGDG